jgi:hypothetical protein
MTGSARAGTRTPQPIGQGDRVDAFYKQSTLVVMGPALRDDNGFSSALLAQPDNHVDPGDLVAFGHFGHLLQHQMRIRDIDQFVVVLEIEVVMRRHIGVELGLGAVDADLAQQARIRELIEGVVDRGE